MHMLRKLPGMLKWGLFPLFDTAYQICLKYLGTDTVGVEYGSAWFLRVLSSPYWWGALASDVASFLMWMLILKKSNLSFAVPFSSIQYILILIASHYLFGEVVYPAHIIGIALIVTGLILVGQSEPEKD